MDFSKLDKNSSEPFYIQLKNLILDEIKRGNFKPNQKIPSIREISNDANISPMTVAQTIKMLQSEGWLYSIPGKGTFVERERKIEQKWERIVGFSEEIRSQGLIPKSKVLSFKVEKIEDIEVARCLEMGLNTKVVRLERIRYANDLPIAYANVYMDYEKIPGILEIDFDENSLYDILQSQFNISLIQANQTIEIVHANQKISQYLEIEPNSACFKTKRTTMTIEQLPIEYVESIYRGDLMRFRLEIGTFGENGITTIKNIIKKESKIQI
jgi:GntR family transcriptional regulator